MDKRTFKEQLEEYEIQVALGTKKRNKNGVTRISPYATEHRIPTTGRVACMLIDCIEKFNGELPWREIRGTKYSSGHVAIAEATGLFMRHKRGCLGDRPKLYYSITDVGRNAYQILKESQEMKTVIIPIRINIERYLYHCQRNW